jgi:anti-sigma factor RsiW
MDDREITEIDLIAYVDGQLDEPCRLAVETALANDPPAAADMMSDLARRTALRLAIAARPTSPSVELASIARRRKSYLDRSRTRWTIAAALTAAVLVGFGSFGAFRMVAETETETVLEDALQSRAATLVRTSMVSQVETPGIAVNEIRQAVRIRLPAPPKGWKVLDVQIFPADSGPSVQLLIDTGAAGRVFLFASREGSEQGAAPVLIRYDGDTVAFWEVDGQSFTLSGNARNDELHAMAVDLSNNRFL